MAEKPTKQQVKLEQELLKLSSERKSSEEAIVAVERMILDGKIKTAKQVSLILEKQEKIQSKVEATAKLEDLRVKKQKELNDLTSSLSDLASDILSTKGDLYKLDQAGIQDQQKIVANKIKEIKAQQKNVDGRTQAGRLLKEQLAVAEDMSKVLQDQSDFIGTAQYERMQGAFQDASDKAAELGGHLDNFFSKLPGGGFLSKALGLDDAGKKLQTGVNAGFAAMNAHLASGGSLMGGLVKGVKAFNTALMVNPFVLIAAAAAGLFMMMGKLEKQAQEFSASTGLDVAQSKQLVKEVEARGAMAGNVLAKNEDILKVQEEMIKRMGTAGKLSVEMATSVAETAKMFGYSADQAAGVQESFETLGATSEEAAKMQEELGLEAFKSGVNVGAVMKDIAENSEDAMRYIAGGAEEMAKAALEGAKMGMNLKQMTKVADGLLDIEKSLTAQFEFQALSGKEINLDKARELALEGDIAGASKAVLEQVKKVGDFNKMSRFEKEKLAEAAGMEVGELAKTIALQDKLGDLSDEQAAAAASLGLSTKQIQEMSKEDLKDAIKKQQSTEKAGKAFEDMLNTIKTALLPVAEVLTDVIGSLAPILNMILYPVKIIGKIFKFLLNDLGVVSTIIKVILASMIAWKLYTKFISGSGGFAGIAKSLASSSKSLAGKVKSMFSLKTVSGFVRKTFGKIKSDVKLMKDDMKGVVKQTGKLGSKFKGLKGKLGDMAKSVTGKLKGLSKSPLAMGGLLVGGGIAAMGAMGAFSGGGNKSSSSGGGETSSRRTAYAKKKSAALQAKGEAVREQAGVTGDGKVTATVGDPAAAKAMGIDYDKMTQAFMTAMQQMPAPQVNMDGKRVSESVSAQQSYDRGIK